MTIFGDLRAFAAALRDQGSLLALDVSKRRFGIAGTDVERRLTKPLRTLQRQGFRYDVTALGALVQTREAVGLVVGLPLMADGRFGPRAQAAKDTARSLGGELRLPVWLQDERWSTAEATARGGDDATAAQIILDDTLRDLHRLGLR
ncbi:MAG: Holliday junction resolvase RuvX [Pseudomonadota bacterium]